MCVDKYCCSAPSVSLRTIAILTLSEMSVQFSLPCYLKFP